MGINIFSKKNIWKFVSFAFLIIFGNIDFFIIRSGVAKGIVNAFKWLFNFMNQGVPNFVTNLLLVVALGCVIYMFIKINSMSKLKRERTYIGFSKVKKAERKKPLKEEYRVVLQHLIQRDHYGDHRSAVLRVYQGQYPNKGELELGITLKELQRLGYITQVNTGGVFFITITDRACEKLSE